MFLADWLAMYGMTNKAFAKEIRVTEEAARLFRAGLRMAGPNTMERIAKATNGLVSYQDMLDAFNAEKPKRTHDNAGFLLDLDQAD